MSLWWWILLLSLGTRTTNGPAVVLQNIPPPRLRQGVRRDCGCVGTFFARRIDTLANAMCTTLVPSGRDDFEDFEDSEDFEDFEDSDDSSGS